MRRASFSSEDGRRALRAVVVGVAAAVVALTTLGCDNSMNFNPVAPDWPDWPAAVPGSRTLQIEGTLEIQQGGVLEATVLYDGLEVPGARSRCPRPTGCAVLELETSLLSASGHHTIAFQVLRQSQEVMDYRAEGTVLVSRENVNLGGVPMRLGPTRARLAAGDTVTFDVQFAK
jgi:hypothetical protein